MSGNDEPLLIQVGASAGTTVDGRNPAPVEVVQPIIYKVLYIPGGAGFLPSTVGIPDDRDCTPEN